MNQAPGRFITIEGGEGTGKSTQARLLSDWLRDQNIPTLLTREPGGSPSAEVLRQLLLTGAVAPFGPEAEALVFAIARADHLQQTIRPALARGQWVVSDRFMDSTWAYQGSAGVPADLMARLDGIAVGESRPDLTLILDLPVEIGMERLRARASNADRFESDPPSTQEARRNAFLRIAAAEPARCVVIDVTRTESEVSQAIRHIVADKLLASSAQAI